MEAVTQQIRNYLQFIALQFISKPEEAELRVAEMDDQHLSFRLIVSQDDIAMLIGRNGFTASAIRNVLKAAAERENIQASLRIESHEEQNDA